MTDIDKGPGTPTVTGGAGEKPTGGLKPTGGEKAGAEKPTGGEKPKPTGPVGAQLDNGSGLAGGPFKPGVASIMRTVETDATKKSREAQIDNPDGDTEGLQKFLNRPLGESHPDQYRTVMPGESREPNARTPNR